MDSEFMKLVEALEPKYMALIAMDPVKYSALPRPLPLRGIYLFSEGGINSTSVEPTDYASDFEGTVHQVALNLRQHLHFRIARETTGRLKATYSRLGSRAELVKDLLFSPAFKNAKQRVALMDLRLVEETVQTRQALLEIYAATVLKTPYNDFDTH